MKRTTAMVLVLLMLLPVCTVLAQADSYWSCSICGKQNKISSNFCGNCGSRRQADSIGWVCYICGTENGTEAQLCSNCGKDKSSFPKIIRPGRTILFGHYEQDGNMRTSDEPIEWMVLEVDPNTNTALVLSVNCLAGKSFHKGDKYPGWAKSDIRAWLNNDFLNTAFTMGEQQFICLTNVRTEEVFGHSGGPDSMDQLFLLSRDEVKRYFPGETPYTYFYCGTPKDTYINPNRCAAPTPWAERNGCYAFDEGISYVGMSQFEGYSYWWLRSPGEMPEMASMVYFDGRLGNFNGVSSPDRGIRPAMWIKLSPTATESSWICGQCGKNNPMDGSFCTKCGAKRS